MANVGLGIEDSQDRWFLKGMLRGSYVIIIIIIID